MKVCLSKDKYIDFCHYKCLGDFASDEQVRYADQGVCATAVKDHGKSMFNISSHFVYILHYFSHSLLHPHNCLFTHKLPLCVLLPCFYVIVNVKILRNRKKNLWASIQGRVLLYLGFAFEWRANLQPVHLTTTWEPSNQTEAQPVGFSGSDLSSRGCCTPLS